MSCRTRSLRGTYMVSIPPDAAWQQAYDAWWTASEATRRPCPRCGQRRVRHGRRARYVEGQGESTWVAVIRLRCRPCHTVETVFPPWLWPYLSWHLALWVAVCTARWEAGQSWSQIAQPVTQTPATVRRRVRAWQRHLVAWRQQALQAAAPWGVHLAVAWVVTTAASGVAADWAALVRLWSAVATALAWPGDPPLVAWCAGAPHVVPAALVPPHTHWGRRLRAAGGCPP